MTGTVIDAATKAPLAGAEVTATVLGNPDFVRTATTDADGHYAIRDLQITLHTVKAVKLNYAEQFFPGVDDPDRAQPVYPQTIVNFALSPVSYGSLAGKLRRHGGGSIAGATVSLTTLRGTPRKSTTTATDGTYTFDQVEPRDYRVSFELASGNLLWAHGKSNAGEADPFTVKAGARTTVNETAPPLGTLTVKVVDAVSGEPLEGAQVNSGLFREIRFPSRKTDATGTVVYRDLRTGTYTVGVESPGSFNLRNEVSGVVVRENRDTTVTVRLGRTTTLQVTAVDAATSAPVAGFCLWYLTSGGHNVAQEDRCTTTNHLQLRGFVPDRYRLFVQPSDEAYGAQIVGTDGGTGNLDDAMVFDAEAGQTVNVTVKLDRAGAITGVIRDRSTGKPVPLCATVLPSAAQDASVNTGRGCADTDGRYTISGLGPYTWRIQVADYDGVYAWGWSGGGVNRRDAAGIKVTAGGTATANVPLRRSGRITGTAKASGRVPVDTEVVAVDTVTGDYAGFHGIPDENGRYTVVGLNDVTVAVYFTSAVWSPDPFSFRYSRTLHPHPGRTVSGINFAVKP
jgi:hypothetical protein